MFKKPYSTTISEIAVKKLNAPNNIYLKNIFIRFDSFTNFTSPPRQNSVPYQTKTFILESCVKLQKYFCTNLFSWTELSVANKFYTSSTVLRYSGTFLQHFDRLTQATCDRGFSSKWLAILGNSCNYNIQCIYTAFAWASQSYFQVNRSK